MGLRYGREGKGRAGQAKVPLQDPRSSRVGSPKRVPNVDDKRCFAEKV